MKFTNQGKNEAPQNAAMSRFGPDDKLILTNLKKVFWPECGYTKGDLLEYYRAIAPVMVPYLAIGPRSCTPCRWSHRKELTSARLRHTPKWLTTTEVDLHGKKRDFHLCQDWPTLPWLANFGCIEFSTWNSRVDSIDRPDYTIIDLDPEDVPFHKVVEIAIAVRRIVEKGAEGYCKTSGKRGLHVYIPLGRRYTFEQSMMLSKLVARMVHHQFPAITSLSIFFLATFE